MVNAGEISPDNSGGSSVYYSHLELLHALGYHIDLIIFLWDDHTYNTNDYQKIEKFVAEIVSFHVEESATSKGLKRIYHCMFDPLKFEYTFTNRENVEKLRELLYAKKYDLVWCEWRWTAILYAQLKESKKAIYSHHDWEFKLSKHRNRSTLKQRFHRFQKKRGEYALVKHFTACVSGSQTEALEIEAISKKKAMYLPTTYAPKKMVKKTKKVTLVHLGGMNTTANRLGLERFLDVCWAPLKQLYPDIKIKVIGSMSSAHTSLLEKTKDVSVVLKGFVKDLDEEMYAGDVHIIPWEYNTGTRTRLPVALNYEQAVVATKASIKAFPEMINDKNVLLCDTLEQMTLKIASLLEKEEQIDEISKAGKETFLLVFTTQGQQEKLKTFIESI